MVFLQTFLAELRHLVLGQMRSEIDAKCGDHFLQADISGLINEERRLPRTPRSPKLLMNRGTQPIKLGAGRPVSRAIHRP